jgi:tripartite ATP-independent transporter DctM subunit
MLITIVLVFLALIAFSVPIAFSMGIVSLIGMIWTKDFLMVIPQRIFTGIDSFVLLAIPFFILAGDLMEAGGISQRLMRLADSLVGHLRGGLGMVAVVAEIFFSGISGSTSADTAAMSSMMGPAMKQSGYPPERAAAIICASCGMGILVPPCIAMVVYGIVANVSIAALFAAGFLPAFFMASLIMVLIYFQAKKLQLVTKRRSTLKEIYIAFKDALLALLMPVIIFGGILGGATTATEAAVIAVVYGLVVGVFIYKEVTWKRVGQILVNTTYVTGIVLFLIGVASVFSWLLTLQQVPQDLANLMLKISNNPEVFLLLTNFVFLFIGAVLEGIPAIIMFTPIFLPIAQKLGVDPVHFGILLIANMGIGVFLPPVGANFFIACSVTGVPISSGARALAPYLVVMFCTIMIMTFWPGLILLLPKLLLSP